MPVEDQVRLRISMLRFLMIFGVVLLHASSLVSLNELTNEPYVLTRAVLQLPLFRCTVPVLTVISGYLLFKSAIHQDPLCLAKKKGKTALDRFARAVPGSSLLACVRIVAMRVANTNYLRLVAPFLIWPTASLLAPTAFGRRLPVRDAPGLPGAVPGVCANARRASKTAAARAAAPTGLIHWLYKSRAHDSFSIRNLFVGKC